MAAGVDVGDNELPYTPDYTATFGGQLSRAITSAISGFARAEIVLTGAFNYDEGNTEAQDAYSIVNLRAGASTSGGVELWLRNASRTDTCRSRSFRALRRPLSGGMARARRQRRDDSRDRGGGMTTTTITSPRSVSVASRALIPGPAAITAIVIVLSAWYLNAVISWRQAALFLVGAAAGVVLYHAAFGFTSSWRVFISDRRGAGLRAQMLMLAITCVVFFPLLAATLFGQPLRGVVADRAVVAAAVHIGWACRSARFASGTLQRLRGSTRSGHRCFLLIRSFIGTATWYGGRRSRLPRPSIVSTWDRGGARGQLCCSGRAVYHRRGGAEATGRLTRAACPE